MNVLLFISIFFVVGLIAGFTNNKREQFQLLFRLILPAALISVIPLLNSISAIGGVEFLVGYFLITVVLFGLGTVISSIILNFTKRKSGEKPEAEEF